MSYYIIPRGNYPLFDVSFQAFDIIHKQEIEDLLIKKGLPRNTEMFATQLTGCTHRRVLGNLSPNTGIEGSALDKLHRNSAIHLNISFFARNGIWNQELLYYHDETGSWHKGMRVFRDQEIVFENITQFHTWKTNQQGDSI